MRKILFVMAILVLAAPAFADAGFFAVIDREVRTVEATSQIRMDQYNPGKRDPFGYTLGGPNAGYIAGNGSDVRFSVDIAMVQPGVLQKVKWSLGLPSCGATLRDAICNCGTLEAWVSCREYKLGSNAIYFWEEIGRGRQIIYRLINIIPIGRRSNTTTRQEFIQFGVEEPDVPINERTDVNMGAWGSRVMAGFRPVQSGAALTLLQQYEDARVKQYQPAPTTSIITCNFKMVIKASRTYVLHIYDKGGKGDQKFERAAGTTTVNIAVEGTDTLCYQIEGVHAVRQSTKNTTIEEAF